ncbi:MAG: hypothetical protein QXP70_04630 [Methanomassiliicoccales archaeon]
MNGTTADEMRKSMLKTLRTEGYHAVAALLEGEIKPGLINGAQPDLVGFNEHGKAVVVQVETCETIATIEAEERLASLVVVMSEGHEYRLLVPTDCKDNAVRWIEKLGLDTDVIWEYF